MTIVMTKTPTPTLSGRAEEACDEEDNDCDGDIDEELMILVFVDQDEDGFGDESSLVEICEVEPGYSLSGGDCDDIDSSINPDADEACEDGIDNNCDGFVDESTAIDAVPVGIWTVTAMDLGTPPLVRLPAIRR